MKIVLDTNVLVSAFLNADGIPARIVNLVFNGKLTLLYDNRLLHEYTRVLARDKFGFSHEMITPVIDFIKNEGIFVTAEPVDGKFQDADDKKFYEVFLSGKGHYLVTGNKKDFPVEKDIVSPAEFLEKI